LHCGAIRLSNDSHSKLHLWQVLHAETGEVLLVLDDHRDSINGAAVVTDPTTGLLQILLGSGDGMLSGWDAQTGERRFRVGRDWRRVLCLVAYVTEGGDVRFACGLEDGVLQVRGGAGGLVQEFDQGTQHLSIGRLFLYETRDGWYRLVSSHLDGSLLVWELGKAPGAGPTVRAANKLG
jgi:WD40 repeat protein